MVGWGPLTAGSALPAARASLHPRLYSAARYAGSTGGTDSLIPRVPLCLAARASLHPRPYSAARYASADPCLRPARRPATIQEWAGLAVSRAETAFARTSSRTRWPWRWRSEPIWFGLVATVLVASAAVGGYLYTRRAPAAAPPAIVPIEAALVLDDAQREQLWQIEHHGLLLTRQGFSELTDALSRRDRKALGHLLAAGFVGAVPDAIAKSRPELPMPRWFARNKPARASKRWTPGTSSIGS